MGSYNMTCGLSSKIISTDDDVVVIPLTKNKSNTSLGIYSWDHFSPIPLLLEGKYSGYGSLSDVKIFDSFSSNQNDEQSLKILDSYLKKNCRQDNIYCNIEDFVGIHTTFISTDYKVELISAFLEIYNNTDLQIDMKEQFISHYQNILKDWGFPDFDSAKNYLLENKDKTQSTPIYFLFIEKNSMQKFLSHYGNETEKNEDYHAQLLQDQRNKIKNSKDTVDFINGGDYAGANHPIFTWHKILKNSNEKNKGNINYYYQQHSIELALINDYFSLLGKPWNPSVSINEDAIMYGHSNAIDMQKLMVENDSIKKKNIKTIKKIN